MNQKTYKIKNNKLKIERPKSFDEVCDRLMALEAIETRRSGRKSDLRITVEAITAILNEEGIIKNEHESLFGGNAGKGKSDVGFIGEGT